MSTRRQPDLRRWVLSVSGAVVALMPLWWVLGLDQLAWLAVGVALIVLAVSLRPLARDEWIPAAGLILVVLVAGVLGASGVRWLTFARELTIAVAFVGVLLGLSAAMPRYPREVGWNLAVVATFVVVSSILSIVVFVFQTPIRFTTVIAPLIPSSIADTNLGSLSFVVRSVADPSWFLGEIFLRPRGLFLFSTSQGVAQAVFIPVALAAAQWYPRYRNLLWAAAGVVAAALVISTSRMPILALLASAAILWLVRCWRRGAIVVSLPLRGPGLAATVAVIVGVGAILYAGGMVQAGINLATTRSLEGRLDLYQMTFKGWLEHPLIGWGTENDWNPAAEPTPTPSPQPTPTPPPGPSPTPVPLTSVPPLGSHSLYLGALYKQGVIGLALVLLLVFAVGRRAVRRYRRGDVGAELMLMAVLTSLLAGLTEDLWLDPATATVIAMSWAMAASFVPSVLPGRDPVEGRADP